MEAEPILSAGTVAMNLSLMNMACLSQRVTAGALSISLTGIDGRGNA